MGFLPGATDSDDGAVGFTHSPLKCGLVGRCDQQIAGEAVGSSATGVYGQSNAFRGAGVYGAFVGAMGTGVYGTTSLGAGVHGTGDTVGVEGESKSGDGVTGATWNWARSGVFGANWSTESVPEGRVGPPAGNGVYGYTDVPNASGVVGAISATNTQGAGITGIGTTAGRFFGNVDVIGNVQVSGDVVLAGNDCAERFDIVAGASAEPGAVMVSCDDGSVRPCTESYDSRVVGVVSGAGDFRPALTLGRISQDTTKIAPIALLGRVFCLVDATYGSVRVGDMLTTSKRCGHAMKAGDRAKAFGAVLGKSMGQLSEGRGLVPVLVSLQ